MEIEEWMARGSCVGADPELFFDDRQSDWKKQQAMDCCNRCVVRERCLEYALKHKIKFGIWGGTTEVERRKLRKGS